MIALAVSLVGCHGAQPSTTKPDVDAEIDIAAADAIASDADVQSASADAVAAIDSAPSEVDATVSEMDVQADQLMEDANDGATDAAPNADALADSTPLVDTADIVQEVEISQDAGVEYDFAPLDPDTKSFCESSFISPEVGSPCTKLGELHCSNVGAQYTNFDDQKYPYCWRSMVVRCDAAAGTNQMVWTLHSVPEVADVGPCSSNEPQCEETPSGPKFSARACLGKFPCEWSNLGKMRCTSDNKIAQCQLGSDAKLELQFAGKNGSACLTYCQTTTHWFVDSLADGAPLICKSTVPGVGSEPVGKACLDDPIKGVHYATSCEELGKETSK